MPGSRVDGEELAKQVSDIYADGTATLLARVARRLAAGLDEPGWAEAKLAETDALRRQAADVVRRITEQGGETTIEVTEQALTSGAESASDDLQRVGTSVRGQLVRTDREAVLSFARAAVDAQREAEPAILRSVQDGYRRAVRDTASRVVAGTATRREAAAAAVDRMAADGLGGFRDSAGRTWEIESYAEMATRTAAGRANVAGYTEQMRNHGHDLVIVSSSSQPCTLCDSWEGQVLSTSGDTSGEAVATTGEAEAAGLLHNNCRHSYQLWVPGVTDEPDLDPLEERQERYVDRQRQREIERRIREWKRRAAALEPVDEQAAKRARAKVRSWQGRARAHADAPGAKRRYDRESLGAR